MIFSLLEIEREWVSEWEIEYYLQAVRTYATENWCTNVKYFEKIEFLINSVADLNVYHLIWDIKHVESGISINFQGKFLTLLRSLCRKEESFLCSLLFRPLEFTFIIQSDQWVCEYFRRLVISIYVSLPSFFLLLLTFVWKYMFDIHFIFILHFK